LASTFVGTCLVAACGARTGLVLPDLVDAAVKDVREEPETSFPDVTPIHDAHLLDVMPECSTPTYCNPSGPGGLNYVWKCGVKIEECSSLEQCFEPCGEEAPGDDCAAKCVNPCLNTLGQNTSNGCEFYPVEMDQTDQSIGVCYAVFVVNQWQTGQPAKLEVDLGGKPYSVMDMEGFIKIPSGTGTSITYGDFDPTVGLPESQIAILFLSRDPSVITPGCPGSGSVDCTLPSTLANCPPGVTPAVVGNAALLGTGVGTAFHIKSNVPIVAYQMMPYGGGHARVTGATLLPPTNVWGTNYVAVNAYKFPPIIGGCDAGESCTPRAGPSMDIIASQDNTHVTIDPVTDIVAGGPLLGTKKNTPITYTLDKGQYLQFTQPIELTGSIIQSDNPVGVLGGSTVVDLPLDAPRADHAEQMIPPISALGSEYVAVRSRSRSAPTEEVVPWRMVGVVSGTSLTYDPPTPPTGAPTTLSQGQLAEFDDTGPWVVSSQDAEHPFYMAQYMTGGGEGPLDGGNPYFMSFGCPGVGDPEFIDIISPQQFLPSYTFFTDPTYPETNLVIVAAFDPVTSQFPVVNLDCAGTLSGFQPVGTSGKYEFLRFDLSTGDYEGQNGCNNGVHTITATLPGDGAPVGDVARIGVTIWGWGSGATFAPDCDASTTAQFVEWESNPNFTRWVSYGYPAGANFAKLNSVVVPAT
jgi:hypothetical protein